MEEFSTRNPNVVAVERNGRWSLVLKRGLLTTMNRVCPGSWPSKEDALALVEAALEDAAA